MIKQKFFSFNLKPLPQKLLNEILKGNKMSTYVTSERSSYWFRRTLNAINGLLLREKAAIKTRAETGEM